MSSRAARARIKQKQIDAFKGLTWDDLDIPETIDEDDLILPQAHNNCYDNGSSYTKPVSASRVLPAELNYCGSFPKDDVYKVALCTICTKGFKPNCVVHNGCKEKPIEQESFKPIISKQGESRPVTAVKSAPSNQVQVCDTLPNIETTVTSSNGKSKEDIVKPIKLVSRKSSKTGEASYVISKTSLITKFPLRKSDSDFDSESSNVSPPFLGSSSSSSASESADTESESTSSSDSERELELKFKAIPIQSNENGTRDNTYTSSMVSPKRPKRFVGLYSSSDNDEETISVPVKPMKVIPLKQPTKAGKNYKRKANLSRHNSTENLVSEKKIKIQNISTKKRKFSSDSERVIIPECPEISSPLSSPVRVMWLRLRSGDATRNEAPVFVNLFDEEMPESDSSPLNLDNQSKYMEKPNNPERVPVALTSLSTSHKFDSDSSSSSESEEYDSQCLMTTSESFPPKLEQPCEESVVPSETSTIELQIHRSIRKLGDNLLETKDCAYNSTSEIQEIDLCQPSENILNEIMGVTKVSDGNVNEAFVNLKEELSSFSDNLPSMCFVKKSRDKTIDESVVQTMKLGTNMNICNSKTATLEDTHTPTSASIADNSSEYDIKDKKRKRAFLRLRRIVNRTLPQAYSLLPTETNKENTELVTDGMTVTASDVQRLFEILSSVKESDLEVDPRLLDKFVLNNESHSGITLPECTELSTSSTKTTYMIPVNHNLKMTILGLVSIIKCFRVYRARIEGVSQVAEGLDSTSTTLADKIDVNNDQSVSNVSQSKIEEESWLNSLLNNITSLSLPNASFVNFEISNPQLRNSIDFARVPKFILTTNRPPTLMDLLANVASRITQGSHLQTRSSLSNWLAHLNRTSTSEMHNIAPNTHPSSLSGSLPLPSELNVNLMNKTSTILPSSWELSPTLQAVGNAAVCGVGNTPAILPSIPNSSEKKISSLGWSGSIVADLDLTNSVTSGQLQNPMSTTVSASNGQFHLSNNLVNDVAPYSQNENWVQYTGATVNTQSSIPVTTNHHATAVANFNCSPFMNTSPSSSTLNLYGRQGSPVGFGQTNSVTIGQVQNPMWTTVTASNGKFYMSNNGENDDSQNENCVQYTEATVNTPTSIPVTTNRHATAVANFNCSPGVNTNLSSSTFKPKGKQGSPVGLAQTNSVTTGQVQNPMWTTGSACNGQFYLSNNGENDVAPNSQNENWVQYAGANVNTSTSIPVTTNCHAIAVANFNGSPDVNTSPSSSTLNLYGRQGSPAWLTQTNCFTETQNPLPTIVSASNGRLHMNNNGNNVVTACSQNENWVQYTGATINTPTITPVTAVPNSICSLGLISSPTNPALTQNGNQGSPPDQDNLSPFNVMSCVPGAYPNLLENSQSGGIQITSQSSAISKNHNNLNSCNFRRSVKILSPQGCQNQQNYSRGHNTLLPPHETPYSTYNSYAVPTTLNQTAAATHWGFNTVSSAPITVSQINNTSTSSLTNTPQANNGVISKPPIALPRRIPIPIPWGYPGMSSSAQVASGAYTAIADSGSVSQEHNISNSSQVLLPNGYTAMSSASATNYGGYNVSIRGTVPGYNTSNPIPIAHPRGNTSYAPTSVTNSLGYRTFNPEATTASLGYNTLIPDGGTTTLEYSTSSSQVTANVSHEQNIFNSRHEVNSPGYNSWNPTSTTNSFSAQSNLTFPNNSYAISNPTAGFDINQNLNEGIPQPIPHKPNITNNTPLLIQLLNDRTNYKFYNQQPQMNYSSTNMIQSNQPVRVETNSVLPTSSTVEPPERETLILPTLDFSGLIDYDYKF